MRDTKRLKPYIYPKPQHLAAARSVLKLPIFRHGAGCWRRGKGGGGIGEHVVGDCGSLHLVNRIASRAKGLRVSG